MKLDIYTQTRFEYIETQLFWGDGITAGELAETFGISRQAAQAVINQYRQMYEGQMIYNRKQKRHQASEAFKPVLIRTSPIQFLDYLRGHSLVSHYREEPDWSSIRLTDVDRLLRPDLPLKPIKTVMSALLSRKTVEIEYLSKDRESPLLRIISPNHLIFADDRYHLRAYCHLRQKFRDFVLARIRYAEPAVEDWVSSAEDREWNEMVELKFVPNPELPESVQKAILHSYGDPTVGVRTIRCRKALRIYIRRKLADSADPKYKIPLWKVKETP